MSHPVSVELVDSSETHPVSVELLDSSETHSNNPQWHFCGRGVPKSENCLLLSSDHLVLSDTHQYLQFNQRKRRQ